MPIQASIKAEPFHRKGRSALFEEKQSGSPKPAKRMNVRFKERWVAALELLIKFRSRPFLVGVLQPEPGTCCVRPNDGIDPKAPFAAFRSNGSEVL